MKINEILKNVSSYYLDENLEIKSIAYDSRKVSKDSLFIAIKGLNFDGHDYIDESVSKGAVAVIANRNFTGKCDVPLIKVKNTREALSNLSANFYNHPSREMNTIGITGTNGKTTTCYLVNEIFNSHEMTSGSIGTLGFISSSHIINTEFTTPESLELHGFLNNLIKGGIENVVIEASSHALAQHRLDDVEINTAVYTNLSQDHLDFHNNMDSYFSEKLKLFTSLNKKSSAIINIDDKYSEKIIKNTSAKIYKYGFSKDADIYPIDVTYNYDSTSAKLSIFNEQHEIESSLPGKHNLYNIMASIHVGLINHLSPASIVKSIKKIKFIPGRMEYVGNLKYKIYIDYAHTPDAFKNILSMIKNLKDENHRIITLFGCGGNRDSSKRPLMSKIAEKYSDSIIITSDNPRNEALEDIIDDMVKGFSQNKHQIIKDRKDAIAHAISTMNENSILLILGKGRENYEIINGIKKQHNDINIVKGLLNEN